MDPPRTRSRSRSGFYLFGVNNNVGNNGSGNAVSNASMMNASGGGVSYPQQSNPGWPHHGGRSYPENQPQHTQGNYLSAGAQRNSSHGAHRHPGAGKQPSVNRACTMASFNIRYMFPLDIPPEGCRQTTSSGTGFETINFNLWDVHCWLFLQRLSAISGIGVLDLL